MSARRKRVVDDPTPRVGPKPIQPQRTTKTLFVLPFNVTPTTYQAVTEEIGVTFPEEPVVSRPIPRVGDQVFYFLVNRNNLPVMPERTDLTFKEFNVSSGVATDVLAAVAGKQHKIYALGYEFDTDGKAGFQWNAIGDSFARRLTKGVYAQTFTNPMIGPVGLKLSWAMQNNGNAIGWVEYITE
jgi:hypothetical protein